MYKLSIYIFCTLNEATCRDINEEFSVPGGHCGSWSDQTSFFCDSKSNPIRFVESSVWFQALERHFSRAWRGRNPITIIDVMETRKKNEKTWHYGSLFFKHKFISLFFFLLEKIKIQFRFDFVGVKKKYIQGGMAIVSGGRFEMILLLVSDSLFSLLFFYSCTYPIITSKNPALVLLLLLFFNPPPSCLATSIMLQPTLFSVVCAVIYEWSTSFFSGVKKKRDEAIFVPCLFIQRKVFEWAMPTRPILRSGIPPLKKPFHFALQVLNPARLICIALFIIDFRCFYIKSPLEERKDAALLKSSRSASLDTNAASLECYIFFYATSKRERERDSTQLKG